MKNTLFRLTLIGLMSAVPTLSGANDVAWERSELLWNDQYDAYMITPTLNEDLFQEGLVWSDRHADYVSAAMAREAELERYREQMVWSDEFDAYVARAMIEPCPRIGTTS